MSGIRAELVFENADECPVARVSETVDGQVTEISWGQSTNGSVTEQFTAPADSPEMECETVFDYGPQQVYEFDRDKEKACICEDIEEGVGPVTEVYAEDGDLHVTLHARDMPDLREMIGELNEEFGQVQIEYLVQGRSNEDDADLIPVDMRKLTERQREVLSTAHRMGYFDYPRQANASEVAEELDIQPSTFTEHLNAAQTKLLEELL